MVEQAISATPPHRHGRPQHTQTLYTYIYIQKPKTNRTFSSSCVTTWSDSGGKNRKKYSYENENRPRSTMWWTSGSLGHSSTRGKCAWRSSQLKDAADEGGLGWSLLVVVVEEGDSFSSSSAASAPCCCCWRRWWRREGGTSVDVDGCSCCWRRRHSCACACYGWFACVNLIYVCVRTAPMRQSPSICIYGPRARRGSSRPPRERSCSSFCSTCRRGVLFCYACVCRVQDQSALFVACGRLQFKPRPPIQHHHTQPRTPCS